MKKIARTANEVLKEFEEILALEEKAAEVYHRIALDCDIPEVQDQLEKISVEELGHVKIAKELVQMARNLVEKKS